MPTQHDNLPNLKQQFFARFPGPANTVRCAQAPGRVNLIGEHTDYNDGFVCPMAIDRRTTLLFRPRPDHHVIMHSNIEDQTSEFLLNQTIPKDPKSASKWSLYPRGVAEALRERGLIAHGMDCLVDSTVPIGGGLSSSASFEVATAFALLAANQKTMDLQSLALACQWAENQYAGVPCGIMDQFISAMGERGHALLIDCRSYATKQVPLDDPELRIVIVNSNVKHELVQGEYKARRTQCETAVQILKKKFPRIKALRDATLNQLEELRLQMDTTVFRRAHHVITENQRTLDFVAALEKRDYALCGKLMYASHESLRTDYGVSSPELDTLVEISKSVPGVHGARMTGGGFGGCIVALVPTRVVAPLTQKIDAEYPRAHHKQATTFITVPSPGALLVE